METPILISVIGGSQPPREAFALAEEVGRELARRGAGVVCGGLTGVMEAVCRGARSEGGLTIGVLPGYRREDANPYVQVPLVTGLGYARNAMVVRSGRAVIAIDGSYGTLSEIAIALADGIPVVALQSWELSLKGEADRSIRRASTPREAVELALALARAREVSP